MKRAYLGLALYVLSMVCFAVFIWFIWPPASIVLLVVTLLLTIYYVRLLLLNQAVSTMYPRLEAMLRENQGDIHSAIEHVESLFDE